MVMKFPNRLKEHNWEWASAAELGLGLDSSKMLFYFIADPVRSKYRSTLSSHQLKRAILAWSKTSYLINFWQFWMFDSFWTVFARRMFGSFATSFERRLQTSCRNLSSFSSQTENRFLFHISSFKVTIAEKARSFNNTIYVVKWSCFL